MFKQFTSVVLTFPRHDSSQMSAELLRFEVAHNMKIDKMLPNFAMVILFVYYIVCQRNRIDLGWVIITRSDHAGIRAVRWPVGDKVHTKPQHLTQSSNTTQRPTTPPTKSTTQHKNPQHNTQSPQHNTQKPTIPHTKSQRNTKIHNSTPPTISPQHNTKTHNTTEVTVTSR